MGYEENNVQTCAKDRGRGPMDWAYYVAGGLSALYVLGYLINVAAHIRSVEPLSLFWVLAIAGLAVSLFINGNSVFTGIMLFSTAAASFLLLVQTTVDLIDYNYFYDWTDWASYILRFFEFPAWALFGIFTLVRKKSGAGKKIAILPAILLLGVSMLGLLVEFIFFVGNPWLGGEFFFEVYYGDFDSLTERLFELMPIFLALAMMASTRAYSARKKAEEMQSAYQPAPRPTPAAAPVLDPVQVLANFKKLLDDGIITEEQYNAKKRELFGIEQPAQPVAQPVPDSVQALRNFKQLLDDGVITEEEYNAKKKQLLGL